MKHFSKLLFFGGVFLIFNHLDIHEDINPMGSKNYNNHIKKNLVILDPGHGGKDCGTQFSDINEDEIAYDISVRTMNLLGNNDYIVHQTVYDADTKFNPQENLKNNEEEFLIDKNSKKIKLIKNLLNKRCSLINEVAYKNNKDPILVSIHVNNTLPFVKGACVYYPPMDLCGSIVEEKSKRLAGIIINSFKERGIPTYSIDLFGVNLNVLDDVLGYDKFGLAIFKETNLDNKILIECGNLNNESDRKRLTNQTGRQGISYAIYQGIISYFQQQ